MISATEGAERCAKELEADLQVEIEVVDRRMGLTALRRGQFAIVVVDESLLENDPAWADQVWELAALPMQVNFALWGCARLSRELKAALMRREGERAAARREAAFELGSQLKSSVTGLLLLSELALLEPGTTPSLTPKLQQIVELVGALRNTLEDREARQEQQAARST